MIFPNVYSTPYPHARECHVVCLLGVGEASAPEAAVNSRDGVRRVAVKLVLNPVSQLDVRKLARQAALGQEASTLRPNKSPVVHSGR